MSAPLSPLRLYAQLEMGKGPQAGQPNWPTYDPRLHVSPGMPVDRMTGPSSYRVSNASNASRSNGVRPGGGPVSEHEPPSPLPVFAPFSPPAVPSLLRPSNGEARSYISPSTLLSPEGRQTDLPVAAAAVDDLADNFGSLGVQPPGRGAENPVSKRSEEISQSGIGKVKGKEKKMSL